MTKYCVKDILIDRLIERSIEKAV